MRLIYYSFCWFCLKYLLSKHQSNVICTTILLHWAYKQTCHQSLYIYIYIFKHIFILWLKSTSHIIVTSIYMFYIKFNGLKIGLNQTIWSWSRLNLVQVTLKPEFKKKKKKEKKNRNCQFKCLNWDQDLFYLIQKCSPFGKVDH